MSPSEGSATPSSYSEFHIQYRHALITEFGIGSGVVDGYILPRRIPQLYAVWRHLRTKDNPIEIARQIARETYEEGNYAKAAEEEVAQRIAQVLRDSGYTSQRESLEEEPEE
jgi:hypothetical protein